MSSLVGWFDGLFDDVTTTTRSGLTWSLDRAEPPLTVHVQPADRPTMSHHLADDGPRERRAFATELQSVLNPLLGVDVPPCPTHEGALEAVEMSGSVSWRCKEGDFSCAVGGYREALWPPGPDEPAANLAPLLGHHLSRRGVMHGIASWSVRRQDGTLVADISLRPGADEAAIRKAADPVQLNVSRVGAVTTTRFEEPATEREPAKRVLAVRGAAMHLALLRGTLRRSLPEENCDIVVESHASRIRVRLVPDHRLGGPGEALVYDHLGDAFADVGDHVACVGGYGPSSHVEGDAGVFAASRLSVYTGTTNKSAV